MTVPGIMTNDSCELCLTTNSSNRQETSICDNFDTAKHQGKVPKTLKLHENSATTFKTNQATSPFRELVTPFRTIRKTLSKTLSSIANSDKYSNVENGHEKGYSRCPIADVIHAEVYTHLNNTHEFDETRPKSRFNKSQCSPTRSDTYHNECNEDKTFPISTPQGGSLNPAHGLTNRSQMSVSQPDDNDTVRYDKYGEKCSTFTTTINFIITTLLRFA